MNKKIILSIIGVAALVIPVILLITFATNDEAEVKIPTGQRPINKTNVQEVVNKASPPPKAIPLPVASPTPASSSADIDPEGSSSAQQ